MRILVLRPIIAVAANWRASCAPLWSTTGISPSTANNATVPGAVHQKPCNVGLKCYSTRSVMQIAVLTFVAFYFCEEDLNDSKVAGSPCAIVVVAVVCPQYFSTEAVSAT